MPEAKHYSMDGKEVGKVELPESAFGAEPNPHVVWDVVRAQANNRRQGTASTKTRTEVEGGGRKPWRQKGTGRARHGSTRSPIWKGGAVAHGPRPRSYRTEIPRRVRRLALVSTLSQRAREGGVAVVDDFEMEAPRTKTVAAFLATSGFEGRSVCFITRDANREMVKSCRNIPGVNVLTQSTMNVGDLVAAEILFFTPAALERVKEVYGP
jgi:large subunit ribosomal protein L4